MAAALQGAQASFPPVALIPTLVAIGVGVALGLHWGGRIDELLSWRPPMWEALAIGIVLTVVCDLVPVSGWFASLLAILALVSLLAFAVVNVRIGGMILVVVGLGLDLLVTLLSWGTPVSVSALESAGAISADTVGRNEELVLTGGRVVSDGARLGFLGDIIPLPWGQVISIGDVLTLVGLALVTASVLRRFEVGPGGRAYSYPTSSARGLGRGPSDYRNALDALGRGPAPRRGPGLHPSRMPKEAGSSRRRRRPGTGPR